MNVKILLSRDITTRLFSASNRRSQIKLSSAGKSIDSCPHDEEKRKNRYEEHKKNVWVLTVFLMFAACALAGTENKGLLRVAETVTVGGKQLQRGTYQLEWTGTGSNVELGIMKGREIVTQMPAQLVPLKKAEAGDGYSTNTQPSGNKALTGILFGGKKYELSVGEASAETTTPSSKSDARN